MHIIKHRGIGVVVTRSSLVTYCGFQSTIFDTSWSLFHGQSSRRSRSQYSRTVLLRCWEFTRLWKFLWTLTVCSLSRSKQAFNLLIVVARLLASRIFVRTKLQQGCCRWIILDESRRDEEAHSSAVKVLLPWMTWEVSSGLFSWMVM